MRRQHLQSQRNRHLCPCTGCQACNAANGLCTECAEGFGLSSNGSGVACSSSQFTNQTTFLCNDCNTTLCKSCSLEDSRCTSCDSNFGLNNFTCSQCTNGTISDGFFPCAVCTTANCTACNANDTCLACLACPATFTLQCDNTCAFPCNGSVANCDLC